MTDDEWEEFNNSLTERLNSDYPDLYKSLFLTEKDGGVAVTDDIGQSRASHQSTSSLTAFCCLTAMQRTDFLSETHIFGTEAK
jgi:hypothetical protein